MDRIVTYPTPGIMSKTRAVDTIIHEISPACTDGQLCQYEGRDRERKTDIVVNIEVLGERIASGPCGRSIVRDQGYVVARARHDCVALLEAVTQA
jgi:hypothetical protein